MSEFASCGFDAASMRNIAARMELSHGMIRYHYESKEKLWFAAVDFLFQRMEKEMQMEPDQLQALLEGSPEMFRLWLRRYVKYCAKHPEHARIMIQESVSNTPRLKVAVDRNLRRTHRYVLSMVENMKSTRLFASNVSGISMIYIITGACQNIFALASEAKIIFDYDVLTDEAVEAHADTIVSIFCPEERAVLSNQEQR